MESLTGPITIREFVPILLVGSSFDALCFIGVSGSILLLILDIGGDDVGDSGEHISGLFGGLPELSFECKEYEGRNTGDPRSCGEDFEEDE